MADLATIGIGIDSSQITTAKQELQRLGTAFNSAERSASVFVQSFDRAFKTAQRDIKYLKDSARAFQDLVNKANNVTNAYKSAEESASVFSRELQKAEQLTRNQSKAFGELVNQVNTYKTANKSAADSASVFVKVLREQETQALKTARAHQQSINAQLGVSGPRATQSGAGFGAMEAEMERLALKYNKIYASSKLYESSLEELNRAHRFGVISAEQYAREIDQLNLEYQQFANGTTTLTNRFVQYDRSLVTSMKSTNRFGMVAQQVGYQVGDFFVQIQSGTNAFVAFGQQATQLAGLLPGVKGAIVGIGISLTTAILSFWYRSSQATEATNTFAEALKTLRTDTADTALEIERLNRGLRSVAETQVVMEQERLQRELEKATLELEDADNRTARNLRGKIKVLQGQIDANAEILEGYRKQYVELDAINIQLEEQARREQETEDRIKFNYEMYGKFRREGEQIVTEQERYNQRLKDAYQLYASLLTQARDLSAETRRAAENFLRLRQFEGTAAGQALGRYGGRGTTSGRALVANFDLTPDRDRTTSRIRATVDLTRELTAAEQQRLDLLQSIEGSLESGFMSMVDGTKSVKDAFRSMARDIIAELYRVLVVQRIVGSIMGFVNPSPAMLAPGIPVPPMRPRAAGGSIMPGGTYLVGEKGPEIIRPRHSGTVVPAHLSGQGGSGFTQNLTISVTGSDAANVRMEVAKMIPQITEATKAAVIDARRRGGQMKAAFG